MKKIIAGVLLALILSIGVYAYAADTNIFAFETITVPTGSAIGFTAATIGTGDTRAKEAFCTIETANIRWRADGTDPSSTVGHLLSTTDITLALPGPESVAKFKAYSATATSGKLSCSFAR